MLTAVLTETRRTYRAVFSEPEVVIPVPKPEPATPSTDPEHATSSTEFVTAPIPTPDAVGSQPQSLASIAPQPQPLTSIGKKRLREELDEAEASTVGGEAIDESGAQKQKSVGLAGGAEKGRDSSLGPSAKKKKKKVKGTG